MGDTSNGTVSRRVGEKWRVQEARERGRTHLWKFPGSRAGKADGDARLRLSVEDGWDGERYGQQAGEIGSYVEGSG